MKNAKKFCNLFFNFVSFVTLSSFTIWMFFSKILWPFQFNVHAFHFSPLLRENLWKNLLILWLTLKLFIVICRLTKIFQLKFPTKKMVALWNCYQFVIYFWNFEQRLRKKLWKDLPFFFNIFKLPLFVYMFTKFYDQQVTKENMPFVSICEPKLVCCTNFEQYFRLELWKTLQLSNVFLKIVSIFTLETIIGL